MSSFGRRALSAILPAALVLMIGSGGAEAGIIVSDTTVMPTGDPTSELDFKLSIDPNTLVLLGDNITLLDIPDFNGTASYLFTSGSTDYSSFFTIVPTAGSAAGLTDIELVLTANPPAALFNPGPDELSIGDLIVETTEAYPPPPNSPLLNPISYTTLSHQLGMSSPISGSGTTMPAVVPEPASLVLALFGVGLALSWSLVRWRGRGLSESSGQIPPTGRSSPAPAP